MPTKLIKKPKLTVLDLRNLPCPLPVIECKKYLDINREREFYCIFNDYISLENVKKWLSDKNIEVKVLSVDEIKYAVSDLSKDDYILQCILSKEILHDNLPNAVDITSDSEFAKDYPLYTTKSACSLIVFTNNQLGKDEESLAKALMKTYLYSLNQIDLNITDFVFMNKGIYLLDNNTQEREEILKLHYEKNVKLMVCGTCINYYQKQDIVSPEIEVVNMYQIVELQNRADKVLHI